MNSKANSEAVQISYSGLSQRLVSEQLLSAASAAEIVKTARESGVTLVEELVQSGHVPSQPLARLVSEEYGVPMFDLDQMVSEQFVAHLVPTKLIKNHRALPLYRRGNRLFIALSDPTNKAAVDEFKFATGIAAETIIVDHEQLNRVIDDLIAKQDEVFDGDIEDFTSAEDFLPDMDVEEEAEELDINSCLLYTSDAADD